MLEPVGPLAPSVYWRRRVLACGLALLVLVGFVWAVAALAGGDDDAAPADARATALAGAGTAAPGVAPASAPWTPGGPTPGPAAPGPITGAPPGATGGLPAATGALPGAVGAPPGAVGAPPGAAGALPGATGTPLAVPADPSAVLAAPPGGNGFPSLLADGRAATPSATPGTTPATPATPALPAAPTTTTTSAAPAPPAAAPPALCADADLTVTARTDAPRYAAGQKPTFSLVVTNTSSAACVRDLDAAKQAVAVVVRPGEGLWGSNDCSPGDTDDVRTLAPGQEAVFSLRWSGRTSSPGCAGQRTVVPPGDYQLLARLDGIVSAPAGFTLAG